MPDPKLLKADYYPASVVEAEADAFVKENYGSRELMSYRYGTGYHSEGVEAPPQFYRRRLDAFHTILLSYSTVSEEQIYQFRPDNWKGWL